MKNSRFIWQNEKNQKTKIGIILLVNFVPMGDNNDCMMMEHI